MKKLLHIAASPRLERSHSRRLAKEFIAAFLEKNSDYQLEEIDIGAIEQVRYGDPGATAKFKSGRDIELTPREAEEWNAARKSFDALNSADMVVISTPMWNFCLPYHLKHWIDQVTQVGWSFGFDPARGYYPMMDNKKTVFIYAAGSTYGTPEALAYDHLRPYMKLWAKLLGLTYDEVWLEGTNVPDAFARNDPAARKKIAELVAKF
jgi:FMN-dependent NADH-azoreductase